MIISRRGMFQLAARCRDDRSPQGRRLAAAKVRIGVLKFGTVAWELDVLKTHSFDAANGIDLEVVFFAGEDATNVAMLAGEIDIIVSDWLWVSRQRSEGSDLTLAPYSTAVGAMMVGGNSPIQAVADLKGKKIGVAGGPLDKSWLLIQAAGEARPRDRSRDQQRDRLRSAPADGGKGDAGRARCGAELLAFLRQAGGQRFPPPDQRQRRCQGARRRRRGVGAGLRVSRQMGEREQGCGDGLRQGLRAGQGAAGQIRRGMAAARRRWSAPKARNSKRCATATAKVFPKRPVAEEEADAAKLYRVLAEIGGEKLVGNAPEMAPGTFWAGLTNDARRGRCGPARRNDANAAGPRRTWRGADAGGDGDGVARRPLPACGALAAERLAEPRLPAAAGGLASPRQGDGERRASLSSWHDARPRRGSLCPRDGHRLGHRRPARQPSPRRPVLQSLAYSLPQHPRAGDHRARLYLVRPQRGRGDRRGRGQQDPECGRHHARRRQGARSALRRDGRGLPFRPARSPSAYTAAAAAALSRRRVALRHRADLEDRARGRAARPLERRRLPDLSVFPALRCRRYPRLYTGLRGGHALHRTRPGAAL